MDLNIKIEQGMIHLIMLPVGLALKSLLVELVDTRSYCYYLYLTRMKQNCCFLLHLVILHYMMLWHYKPQMQQLQRRLNLNRMHYPTPLNEMASKKVHFGPSFVIGL